MQDTDLDLGRSFDRLNRNEEFRRRATGAGTNRQGQALTRKYLPQLTAKIAADRAAPQDRLPWRALKDTDDEPLALRLLIAGISATDASGVGVDDDGEKNRRDQFLFIGRNLLNGDRHNRELQFRLGVWGVNMLLRLPPFALHGEILTLIADVNDFMDEVLVRHIRNHPLLMPLATPPEPWTGFQKGGLPTGHWAQPSFVIEHHISVDNAVRKAIGTGKMQRVLDAINRLQEVPWAINKSLLDFMEREKRPVVEKPSAKELWKGSVRKQWKAWQALRAWQLDLLIARVLSLSDRFFIPLRIEFRGRIIPIPFFNFAREDHVRALFLFADGEPIGNRGLLQLKAYVAACADGNKWSTIEKPSNLDYAGRVAWTDENLNMLRCIGDAVLRGDDPAKLEWALRPDMAHNHLVVQYGKRGATILDDFPDPPKVKALSNPYQFLAACLELAQALAEGPNFKTRLPVKFDASCSGLQHLSAMTRDEQGGRYANVVPTYELDETNTENLGEQDFNKFASETVAQKPVAHDFYKLVAFKVWNANPHLQDLLDGPFDRELAKRPGMTYFYGSSGGGYKELRPGKYEPQGMTAQVMEVLEERRNLKKGVKKRAKELAHAIYDTIEDMAPGARRVRDFLRRLAWLSVKHHNKPLRWRTPLRLPVINCYYKPDQRSIYATLLVPTRLKSGEIVVRPRRRETSLVLGDTDEIRPEKSRNSVVANFTHSVDATHLQLIALSAAEEGIPLASIHDCFATIAPRAERLNEIARERFAWLHKRHNFLGEVLVSAELPKSAGAPKLPEIGNLDIDGILKSFFAIK